MLSPWPEGRARACVCVRGEETWYSRWGRGFPVVVLLRATVDDPPPGWLSGLGFPASRLLLPEIPPEPPEGGRPGEAFTRWLGGLLDGLGLERAAFACEPELQDLVRMFMHDNAERIEGPLRLVSPPPATR